jgi:hypothetical protein
MNHRALSWPGRALAAFGTAGLLAVAFAADTAAAAAAAPAVTRAAAPAVLSSAAPSAGAPQTSDLSGVAATSARNAWAVGFRYDGSADQTLIEHWNGRSWRQARSPDPGGAGAEANKQLLGVAATSARNAWAVGSYSDGTVSRMLILHWNGRSWKHVPSNFPGCLGAGDGLSGVTATSSTNAWAVGTATGCGLGEKVTVILHWNGRSWREVTSPNSGFLAGTYLRGVAAVSARNAWAVGFYGTGGPLRPLIVHWNGKSWKQVASPGPIDADIGLGGVAAVSAKNAWAAGLATAGTLGSSQGLIFHWNGKSWRQAPSPSRIGEGLYAVAAIPGRTAWAVGFLATSSNPEQTLAERWTGTSWKQAVSPSPGPGPHVDGFQSVAIVPGGGAWAVGAYDDGATLKALIERWNGKSWRTER